MADTVRYLMEEMVPELEDLEQRGYFSRSEIKQIVQKRQDFEYSLKRKATLKEDYLRYVEYETRLEQLRQHRRKDRGITGKKSLADWCIPRRIHFIYERATRKFRGDLALWSRWFSYCQRTGSSRQMSRALTRALQLHPTAPALWTYAAAWEFEHNLNAAAARALMQRGLRMCKEAPGLWHEYFRMELLYAMRLRERRRVLGIGGAEAAAAAEEGAEAEESAAAVQNVLNGGVLQIVYRSAVKAMPTYVAFRRKFLELLGPFDFPGKQALEDLIYSSVAQDFAGSPEAWDMRARRGLDSSAAAAAAAAGAEEGPAAAGAGEAEWAQVQAAISTYEEAVQAVPSPEMYHLFAEFLGERLLGLLGAESEAASQARAPALAKRLLELYGQAAKEGHLTEGMALDWPRLHLRCGDSAAALEAARSAAAALPHSAAVWRQLLALQACVLAQSELASTAGVEAAATAAAEQLVNAGGSSRSSDDDEEGEGDEGTDRAGRQRQRQMEGLVLEAVRSVGVKGCPPVWLAGLQALVGCGAPLDGLCRQLAETVSGLARGPVQGGMGVVAASVLTAVEQSQGLEAARKLYRGLLKLPPAGGEFMHAVLELEQLVSEGAGAGRKPLAARQLRELFEAALDAYGGEDWRLWLRYMQYEQQQGRGAGQVYWRAVKALSDPEPFVQECQLQKLS